MPSSSHIIVGLDVGTKTTRVIVCEVNPSSRDPHVIGIGTAPTHGLHHGYIINRSDAISSIRQALRDAMRDAGVVIKNVSVAMGGISLNAESVTTTVTVEHHSGEVSESDIARAIEACEDVLYTRTNNRRILHTIPLRFHLDGDPVLGNPIGMKGKKFSAKVIFVTCLEHHFDEIVSVVRDAGVNVTDVIAAPLATSYPALSHNHKMAGSALVDIGAETVSIIVFEDDKLISLDIFPIGSTDITNDIALGFQIPLDDAEQVKLGALPKDDPKKFSRSKLEEIIRARFADIFELIDRHLCDIKRSNLLPAGIVITGGGALLENFNIQEFAKSCLHLPIHIVTTTNIVSHSKKKLDSSWYTSYGLCCSIQHDAEVYYKGPSAFENVGKQVKKTIGKLFKQLIP